MLNVTCMLTVLTEYHGVQVEYTTLAYYSVQKSFKEQNIERRSSTLE